MILGIKLPAAKSFKNGLHLKSSIPSVMKKLFFTIFCICCPDTKGLFSLCKFVRCDHHRPPRPKSLNKMSDLLKNTFWYIIREMCNENILPSWCAFLFIPDRLKTQEMFYEAVACSPRMLRHGPDQFRTQEMCIKAVEEDPRMLRHVPDHFKTQEICNNAVEKNPQALQDVPFHFKAQEMGEKAVEKTSWVLEIAPDSVRHRRCVLRRLRKAHAP